MRDRRDEAIVRLMAETALAAGRRLGVRSDGCGWVVDADIIDRDTRDTGASASERAAAEARTLDLGEL